MSLIYKKFVTESFNADGSLKAINFNPPQNFNFAFDVVDELANLYPEKKAMIWVSEKLEDRIFTFSDMKEQSARAANYFLSLGVKKGDKIMLILKRHYQFWFAILGLCKIGAIAIPATHLLTKKDLVYRFNAAEVTGVVCTAETDISSHIMDSLAESPSVKILSSVNGNIDGWDNFDEGIAKSSSNFDRTLCQTLVDDLMLMYFTSGTTGYPKIACHSYSYPLGHIVTAKYWHDVRTDGIHLTVSDTGWAKSAWGKLYGQWLCETCVFTYDFDKFNAHNILTLIDKYKITTFCAPPTMYRFFIKEDLSKYSLKSLKHTTIAGEALNPEVFNKFKEYTGLKLTEGFGQTETTLLIANLLGTEPKPGSMGLPNPQFDIDLIDPDGNTVPKGEVGEIVVRTDKFIPAGFFKGYYNSPETTAKCWHDGIYHTGDTAWRDEDGYFWYVGRTDDLIKSSGYRIGPFEIESVIMEYPKVLECAVTGVPDPVRGQAVKATIVLIKDCQPSEELKKEIQDYVKNCTAPYKYPRVVEFVTELPKTISGKIRRVEIRNS